jgi:hypothetical protein
MRQTVGVVQRNCSGRTMTAGWDRVPASIELNTDFADQALLDLEDFSPVEIIFHFDRIPESAIEAGRAASGWEDARVVSHQVVVGNKTLRTIPAELVIIEIGDIAQKSQFDSIVGPLLKEGRPRGPRRDLGDDRLWRLALGCLALRPKHIEPPEL